MGLRAVAAAAGALLFLAGQAAAEVEKAPERFWTDAKQHRVTQQRSELARVARGALPAVVSITTTSPRTPEERKDGGTPSSRGLGAGFIINSEGYILTSAHVVEDAAEIRIALSGPDGHPEELIATVVGQDRHTDVALLKVDAGRPLPVLKLGSASDVDIADWVVVIGNPFGLSQSVTVGVVSFKGRDDVVPNGRSGYFDYLQTDAPINPGNSGGPILDLEGEVVAIANAVNVAGQGIGFAVPIDVAKAVLPRLKEDGVVHRGWMGLSVLDLTPEIASLFNEESFSGVIVSDIDRGGPADEAGLHVGDVIATIDGHPIARAQALRWKMVTVGVGQRVDLKVRRDGQPMRVEVQLREAPPDEAEEADDKVEQTPADEPSSFGATVSDVDAGAAGRAGLAQPFGALVRRVAPGGPLGGAGLVEGDVVLKVGDAEIAGAQELSEELAKVRAGSSVRLFVRRGSQTLVLTVRRP
ncbi:MAG: trypsin-like peptidase domain-containing protein [Myxococcaceae bacterium]